MAADDRLRFGTELIFTYGPLGFLFVPTPFLGPSSLAAAWVVSGIHLVLCVALLRCARRALPLGIAVGITYLAARISGALDASETLILIAYLVGVELLWESRARPAGIGVVVALGAFAGLAALGKTNTGIVITGIGILVAAFSHRPWWRGVGLFLVGAAASGLLGWVALGGGAEDIPAFIDHAMDIVLGYSAAMGVQGSELVGDVFAAGICIAILAAVGTRVSEAWPLSRRIGLLLIGSALAFASWKTGFTRWHFAFFFGTAVLAVIPLMLDRASAGLTSWAFVSLLLAYVAAVGGSPVTLLDPVPSLRAARDLAVLTIDRERRDAGVAEYRSALHGVYGLSPRARSTLEGHTVHAEPIETGVMWAYPELEWAPYPAFQAYTAYTEDLDALNAEALAGTHGPEYLIRESLYAIDGRHPWWETPRATLEMVCRYREVLVDGRWQILERRASRCGVERPLGAATVGSGESVSVPRAGPSEIVVARIHGLEPTPADRLVTFLLRGPEWHATVNGGLTFRVVPALASGPLLMSMPAGVRYTPPHDLPQRVSRLSLVRADDPEAATEEITIEFAAIPFD